MIAFWIVDLQRKSDTMDRRAWTAQSLMASIDPRPTPANEAGRDRVADGILTPSPHTRPIRPQDHAAQDFIIDPDFLTEAQCEQLVSLFDEVHGRVKNRRIGIDFWEGRIVYMEDVAAHDPSAARIMSDFQKRATAKLGQFYDLTAPLWTDTVQLNIWEPGSCLPPHTDNCNPDGSPHPSFWRDFSSIVYLNDDYEGGELYFTAQDRLIRPRRGMLVAFSAGYHHEHGVLRVTGGRRLTMPAFYTFDQARADLSIYPELSAPPLPLAILNPAPSGPVWRPPVKRVLQAGTRPGAFTPRSEPGTGGAN